MIRVFLDANIFVAAAASSQGGSALLLEAERNIRRKLAPQVLKRFHRLLEESPLLIVPAPSDEQAARCHSLIDPKDAPILAAALSSKSDFLVTLDRKDFMSEKMRNASFPIKILTPRDLFRAVLF